MAAWELDSIDSDNLIHKLTNDIAFKPFITYINDVVFDQHTDTIHSISIGFRLEF